MKAFFLLVLLLMVFFAIGASSFGQVDLTPDTPAVVQQGAQADFVPQPQVIQLQEDQVSAPPVAQQIPITGDGTCTDPYIVQSGDNLSTIAELCNTTVGEIRLANPDISNINMIYVGQSLDMPEGIVGQAPAPLPVTGMDAKDSVVLPVPTATPVALDSPLPVTGPVPVIRPGTILRVMAQNYPPSATVSIGIMPENGMVTVLSTGVTNLDGSITTTITLPSVADPQAQRVVIVSTAGGGVPQVQAVSDPFFISDSP